MNTTQTPPHQIFLFGALRVSQDGNAIPLSGEKTQSLLAYLVLNPRLPHRREKLADLLYPDAPFERGRRNFSDTLYRLQKAIGSDWFVIDRDTVALHLDERLWADVWEFERLSASEQESDLQIAITLYTGDLLPELYDDWLIPERELRRNQYLSMLEKLAVAQEGRVDFRQALLTLRRLVSTEPLHEPAHQSYLRVLGHMQRYGEAQTHYDYLQRMLRSELGVEPLAETRFIAETIENERSLATVQTLTVERTPFVGRKAERASALSSVEAALKGKGGILAIEGAAGIGKSRMLSEIAAGIRWRGAIFLQGTASETPGASPFSPLADALAPLINSPRGFQLETVLADETMAALAALNSPWADKVDLAEVPPEMAVNRFYDALRLLGETLARLSPTVVAFDDLQWADTALWKSVEALAQGLTRGGALVIVIYRRPEIERSQGWEVLQAWDRAGLLNTILLQPLSVEEVAQLIADTHHTDPLEMHAWTGGIPFYINEWLAAPESNKPSRQNPVTNRLPSLSQTARLALESASILGKNVPYRLWAEISAVPPLTLAGLSDELAAHHWLQPSTSGYTFTHDLVRDEVFNQIESSRRSEMHARAARAYQVFEPENLRARAFHLDKAGQIPEAAHVYRLASHQDQARFAFAEAQHALDRALMLLPPASTQERVETDLEMVGLCSITGDLQRQASALKDALDGAQGLGNDHLHYKTLLAAGRVADDAGEIEGAEVYYETALAIARKMGDQQREGEILYWSTVVVAHQGRWRQAQELAEQALVQARAGGDRYIEGKALRAIGIIKSEMEQPAEAIIWLEKSVQILDSIGRNYDMWVSQLNLMTMYSELGIWDRSLQTAGELIAKLDASGARVRAANVRLNLVDVHLATGNFSAARYVIEEIPDNGSSLGARGVAVVKHNLALVAEMQGSYAEAEQLYLEALKFAAASKAFDLVASAQHDLGVMLVHLDRPTQAIAHFESAFAHQQEEGDPLDRLKSSAFLGLALVKSGGRLRAEDLATSGWNAFQTGVPIGDKYQDWLWALFRLLQELGRLSQANEVLQAAYDELQRQAQYIADPTLRRGFFDLVFINRAIVEAYDRSHRISRVRSARLASKHAPLGRLLREDEYVAVQWTVSAPEDESITDKTARRQNQLKRLLAQAESQNAAPTDDDLAQALGVSRRTILRDMQALAQEIPRPPTRKRKA